MESTDLILYHVGCGRELFRMSQMAGMALACACGANAPIVVADLNSEQAMSPCVPASLFSVRKEAKDKPHLQYYLGFSDFDCPAKLAWEKYLREEYGLVAFEECPEQRCQDEPARQREREAYFKGVPA